jgi:hypothetical protein
VTYNSIAKKCLQHYQRLIRMYSMCSGSILSAVHYNEVPQKMVAKFSVDTFLHLYYIGAIIFAIQRGNAASIRDSFPARFRIIIGNFCIVNQKCYVIMLLYCYSFTNDCPNTNLFRM